MLKIKLLIYFSLIFVIGVIGQSKPIFLPDQIDNSKELQLKCYCNPGIDYQSRARGLEILYQANNNRVYSDTDQFTFQNPRSSLLNSSQLEIKAKVPILNKQGLKFLFGYNYTQENYSFDNIGSDNAFVFDLLDKDLLKSSAFSLYFTKSFNENNYLALRTRLIYNGNYDGLVRFRARYSFYNLVGFWGNKLNDDFEWGLGFSLGSDIRGNNQIIPLLLFNKNFSQKWGIESVLPGFVFIRNNINSKAMMFYGVEYKGQNYTLDLPNSNGEDENFIFDHSKIQIVSSLEYQIKNWIWFNAKVGYNFTFTTSFESSSENIFTSFEAKPNNHLFLKIGLFLSPPDSFLK